MTWLRSIRFRIIAAVVVAIAAMLGAMGFLQVQYSAVSARQALITEGYLPIAQRVDALSLYQERVDNDIERLLRGDRRPGTGSASSTVIFSERLRINIEEARIRARTTQKITNDPREQAVLHTVLAQLQRVEELFAQYEEQSSALVAQLESQPIPPTVPAAPEPTDLEVTTDRLDPQILQNTAARLGDEVDKLSRQVQGRISGLAQETEAQRVRANAVAALLALLAIGVCVGGIALVLLALRPIGELTGQVQRLAAGDYSGRLEVRGADELAVLAAEFNAMVEALRLRDRTLVERARQLDLLTRYLGSVLDSLDDGLFVVEDGSVTLANPAATRVWGLTEKTAPPQPLATLLRPGRREARAPDRSLHEVRVTGFGEDGVIVVSADVTEEKLARERLARSERLALVGQMLAQITHEVRNPLNALSLNAELLSDELTLLDPQRSTEAWDLLSTVSGEIERLTAVTAHYLALARRPPAQMDPVDLEVLLDDVIRLLQAELAQQGVEIEIQRVELAPRMADGNQIRQALLNVVRNAVEAGADQLRLSLSAQDGLIRITLADNGPGMTEEEIERATDPFFSTKPTGTGLGLAITRQILEDHGGSLEVQSRPGDGSSMTLVLPDRPSEASQDPPPVEA